MQALCQLSYSPLSGAFTLPTIGFEPSKRSQTTFTVMLREEALVVPDFACFKVTLHFATFFGATRFFPLMVHPPDELQVCFPLPIGLSSEVSATDFPRFTDFVVTATGAAVAGTVAIVVTTGGVVVVVVASTSGFCFTCTIGAEYEIFGNFTFTPSVVMMKSAETSFSSDPFVTLAARAAFRAVSVFSIPHCFNKLLGMNAAKLPVFTVAPSFKK